MLSSGRLFMIRAFCVLAVGLAMGCAVGEEDPVAPPPDVVIHPSGPVDRTLSGALTRKVGVSIEAKAGAKGAYLGESDFDFLRPPPAPPAPPGPPQADAP